MMNKYFLFCLVIVSSCKNDDVKYYNHNKWKWTTDVMGWWFYEYVNNSPAEVKEYFYDSINRDKQDYLNEFPAYIVRKFDVDGNVIYVEEVYKDSTRFISEYLYSDTGMQMKNYVVNNAAKWGVDEKDTSRINTELMKGGKFKMISYNAAGIQPNPRYSIFSFFDKGKRVIEQELFPVLVTSSKNGITTMEDFSDSMEISDTNTKEYDGYGNIIEYGHVNKFGEGYTFIYHYDKNKFLDSIVEKGKSSNRLYESYLNNKYGDPIKSSDAIFVYTYDSKGNWIKRTGNYKKGNLIVIREIKY